MNRSYASAATAKSSRNLRATPVRERRDSSSVVSSTKPTRFRLIVAILNLVIRNLEIYVLLLASSL